MAHDHVRVGTRRKSMLSMSKKYLAKQTAMVADESAGVDDDEASGEARNNCCRV
jgi:hypothetical protein